MTQSFIKLKTDGGYVRSTKSTWDRQIWPLCGHWRYFPINTRLGSPRRDNYDTLSAILFPDEPNVFLVRFLKTGSCSSDTTQQVFSPPDPIRTPYPSPLPSPSSYARQKTRRKTIKILGGKNRDLEKDTDLRLLVLRNETCYIYQGT